MHFSPTFSPAPIHLERKFDTRVAVQVKSVYGQPKVYPVNTQGQLLAAMNGTKTLTYDTLIIAQKMGFQIVQVFPTGELPVSDIRALCAGEFLS